MHLRIDIDCDNMSFNDPHPGAELRHILSKLAMRFYEYELDDVNGHGIMDSNGNTVGRVTVTERASEPDRLRESERTA